ncbi:MAG TPA: phosphodiesterase [Clostridia bacterium]|nr:phosphodiesterase [Clostridia bacterium]
MKLIFISDIHGSLFYAKKAVEAYEREQADFIVILGDVLYHGPRNPLPKEYNPKEVALLFNRYAEKIIAVRGNCDTEVDQMVLEFEIMAPYSTLLCGNRRIFLTHGHILNKENPPKLRGNDVLIYGHSHIPLAEKNGSIYVVNPGSISMPKENNPNTYAVLEEDAFKIMDFEGNLFKMLLLD